MFSILDETALTDFLLAQGEKKYRVAQIQQAVFKDLVESVGSITTLPAPLREKLAAEFSLSSLSVAKMLHSQKDATTKVAFETEDHLFIEAVLMRHLTGRITLCLSSQVGCAMACTFCATGKMGLFRNLKWHEIIDQILFFERLLAKEEKQIRNIVFMGMGEPMANYVEILKSIRIMNDSKKLAKGARHITISTSGLIPGIERLIAEKIQVNLAISLHAPTEELRTELMPINKSYSLKKLMAALDKYTEITKSRIFYEYVMLAGINDSAEHADQLGKLLHGRLAHVNLIPWNPVYGADYQTSSHNTMTRFQNILENYEIPSTIRVSLGDDISAACGQLAKQTQKKGTSIADIPKITMKQETETKKDKPKAKKGKYV